MPRQQEGCWTGLICGTIEELARRERVDRGYMSRVLRLTLLAPDIFEAVLDGRQPKSLRLEDLLDGFPVEWEGQRVGLRIRTPPMPIF